MHEWCFPSGTKHDRDRLRPRHTQFPCAVTRFVIGASWNLLADSFHDERLQEIWLLTDLLVVTVDPTEFRSRRLAR